MKQIVLVSNCQTLGLAHCLIALGRVQVLKYNMAEFHADPKTVLQKARSAEALVADPDSLRSCLRAAREQQNTVLLPAIYFDGYHPDITYLNDASGTRIKGPLGDYHSVIAYTGHRLGLSLQDTLRLFERRTYERLGWLSSWDSNREAFLEKYSAHGFDLRRSFVNWGRTAAFMHSVNHPAIRCLADLAEAVLDRLGLPVNRSSALPHDNLLSGPVFPVYPELAEAVGVCGTNLYKQFGGYNSMSREEFVGASWELYEANPGSKVWPAFEQAFEQTLKRVREML